jgi:hypothetical protein
VLQQPKDLHAAHLRTLLVSISVIHTQPAAVLIEGLQEQQKGRSEMTDAQDWQPQDGCCLTTALKWNDT